VSQHHPSWLVLQLQQVAKVLGYDTKIVYEGNTPAFCQVLVEKGNRPDLDIYKEFNPWANTGYLVEMQYRVAHLYSRFEFRDLGDGYEVVIPKGIKFHAYARGTPQECFMVILIEHGKEEGTI